MQQEAGCVASQQLVNLAADLLLQLVPARPLGTWLRGLTLLFRLSRTLNSSSSWTACADFVGMMAQMLDAGYSMGISP